MKGLSFSEAMIKSWLAGNKTVTRRLMNPQPSSHPWENNPSHELHHLMVQTDKGLYCKFWHTIAENPESDGVQWIKPRYQPGEMVYIKEAWAQIDIPNGDEIEKTLVYKATDWQGWLEYEREPFKWKSPRFMPEWASRSHALIKSVRAERIQEITIEEVEAEGISKQAYLYYDDDDCKDFDTEEYLDAFKQLWDSLHAKDGFGWDVNPWVWVYELEKLP